MGNPYGGTPGHPGAPEPGEQSPYQPYGSDPYSGSPYGGPYAPPGSAATGHGTDGVSIAGFVLSLLCCTSLVGFILGIVGLSRTRNGIRNGRWAAVSAVVIGAVGTLAFAGMVGFFIWFGTSTVRVESAAPGQCVDVDEFSSGNDATLFEKDCSEPHEAEIVAADSFDREQAADVDPGDPTSLCEQELEPEYATALASGDYELEIVFEARDPEPGDPFVCYLQRTDGDKLDESVASY